MASDPIPVPIDPAFEAHQLVDLFGALSQTLSRYLVSDKIPRGTPPAELARLQKAADDLEDLANHFEAEAIKATLQAIQPDLARIKAVTADAKTQLGHLNTVSKVISIATAAVALGTAIASGDPAAILGAVGPFVQAVAPAAAPPAAPAVAT